MDKEKYQIGVDLAYKPSWWKRLLVWFGFKKRDWDYNCIVLSGRDKNGVLHIIDYNNF